jgi:hypothetical protein
MFVTLGFVLLMFSIDNASQSGDGHLFTVHHTSNPLSEEYHSKLCGV